MVFPITTNKKACAIDLLITTSRPEIICIVVFDPMKTDLKNTKDVTRYIDRFAEVNGEQHIYVRLPVCPNELKIAVFNKRNGNIANDNTFTVTWTKKPLICKGIYMRKETLSFLRAISFFAQNHKVLDSTGTDGKGVRMITDDGLFCIQYQNQLERSDGVKGEAATQMRIGQESPIIYISKNKIMGLCVYEIMTIGIHEYRHFFANKNAEDETEADLGSCKIMLSLGFPKLAVYGAFCKIFDRNESQKNKDRYLAIENYVENFNYKKYQYEK